jgi:soluble lytic murein transglycosylase-like protein
MKTTKWMVIFVVFGSLAHAQPASPPDSHAAMEDVAARQRQAVSSMEASLAKQRAAVQQQPLQHQSSGFFVLPPPARLGATVPGPRAADCPPLPAPEVDTLIGDAAKREDLDPDLLRSVMKQESAFLPCAVSPKGAMGLMQLMPATAEQYGVKDPFSPAQNVNAGARL